MEVTPISRPACCKSRLGPLYLLVVAKGRIESDGTELRTFATSSGKASRRKSASLSDPAFWNGSTATERRTLESGLPNSSCFQSVPRSQATAITIASPTTRPTIRTVFFVVCVAFVVCAAESRAGVSTALALAPDAGSESSDSGLVVLAADAASDTCVGAIQR